LPLGIFGAALGLRLIGIASRPFWLDEVFTMQRVRMRPAALIHDSLISHHLPSFFLLLSALVPLGNPQFWLRAPSAVFGAIAVMLVFLIGQRVAGRSAGLMGAMILGLSPAALAYSQEARSYTMLMSLILLALLAMTELAMDIPAASLPFSAPGAARRAWLTFTLASIGAVDILANGFLWVLTANLIVAVMITQSSRRIALLRNILIADLCILVCSVPFYIIMAMTITQKFTDSVGWIPGLSGPRLWYNFASIYLMRIGDAVTFKLMNVTTPALVMWTIDAGLVAAVGLAAWRLRRRPEVLALLGFSFLVLPAALTIISLWQPILLPRYILWSAAPFAILAGIGGSFVINLLPRRSRGLAFAGIALLLLINLKPYYTAETKPRWDIAAQILAKNVLPGDVVFLNDQYALPELQMYLPKQAAAVVLNNSVADLQHAQIAKGQGKRVWAVYGIAGQTADEEGWPAFYASMAPLGAPKQIQMAGNRIYITLYDSSCAQHALLPGPAASPATAPPNNRCG
jgi:4-amino-4-deoxy-L-arabinose transferase-like glycosyltransferase